MDTWISPEQEEELEKVLKERSYRADRRRFWRLKEEEVLKKRS